MSVEPARPARTQGERTAAMRRRLLDATVSSLAEKGYGGTTTLAVQQRAGVSRGALLHHFACRSELMAAAVEHLTHQRMAQVLSLLQEPPPATGRVEWAVRALWGTFSGQLHSAADELSVAARNDPQLLAVLAPQERVLGQVTLSIAADLFGAEVSEHEGFPEVLGLLLDAQRGAAARLVLRQAASDERLVATWTALVLRATS